MQCEKLKTYMETGRVVFLPARVIKPNPQQPRRFFRQEDLQELTESIRLHGILQPLSVRRTDQGYELIAGERRLRAAVAAGLTEIPCILMRMTPQESGLAALVENLQRQDLHYWEEARGIAALMSHYQLSQEECARLLGKSQSGIANKLRLLHHSRAVTEALQKADLTERHARALLRLPTEHQKLQAIEHIKSHGLTVAQSESYIDALLEKKPAKAADVHGFLRRLTQGLNLMQQSGIRAVSQRIETDREIRLTITIPKKAQ